jgi:hypothetical protein
VSSLLTVVALLDAVLYYAIGFIVWGYMVHRYVAYMSSPEFITGLFWRPLIWPAMLLIPFFYRRKH